MARTYPPRQSNPQPPITAPFGCQNCRDQHLKCDRTIPACGRCVATGKECKRGYKFRVKSGPYTRKQQWVKTPRRLDFVEDEIYAEGDAIDDDDELPDRLSPASAPEFALREGQRSYSSDGSRTTAPEASFVGHSTLPRLRRSLRLTRSTKTARPAQPKEQPTFHDHHEHQLQRDIFPLLSHVQPTTGNSQSPSDPFNVHGDFIHTAPSFSFSGSNYAIQPNINRSKSLYPLQNKDEAMLVRHFIQNLAIWLDLCDPTQQFVTVIPQRAAECSVLLNAILALSAKHLAHVSGFDRYASDRYHQECLNMLIPMLSHDATAADENLFAATIILRVWEEMEFKHSGFDSQGYLLGIHAFVHGHGHRIMPNTVSAASFWVGLRQEIYTATVNQQPVKAPLVPSLAESARELGPAADHDWANRAVIHCVDVLNFCFGDTPPQQSWDGLRLWNRRWTELLPPSYTPILYRERAPGEAFPEVWYHTSWHVTGVQHHILAELFLVSFDPRVPRIGRQRREAAKKMNDCICELVRKICGIGLSNQWTPPGMFTACMAIAAFGDRFYKRADQEACLDMLRRTERDHARPTELVQQQMIQSWGWRDEE